MHLLAKELNFQIQEWINPVHFYMKNNQGNLVLPYTPRLQEFRQWILAARAYDDLVVQSSIGSLKKILLIEDLPFLFDADQKQQFVEIVKEYLASSSVRFPVVFILIGSGDNLALQLFPTEVSHSPQVCIIKYDLNV